MNGIKRRVTLWIVTAALVAAVGVFSIARADDASTKPYQRPAATAVTLPTDPGEHGLKFSTTINGRSVKLSYLLHLPPAYSDTNKKLPMLVFLHGLGEVGTDLGGIYPIGPMTVFRTSGSQNPPMRDTCPFIVLCPQCPPRGEKWNDEFIYRAVDELVDQTVKNTRCDPDRVYMTGLSMGGQGTWCVAEGAPDLFAAIAPLSAMEWHPDQAGDLLKEMSIWTVTGLQDESRFVQGNKHMEKSLSHSRADNRFTYVNNEGHWIFSKAFASPQFYEWFLSHHRGDVQKLNGAAPATEPSAATPPGHHLFNFDARIGDQPYKIEYDLYIPKTKPPEGTAGRPAMLFLHERDTIGPDYHDICMHGPDLALERDPGLPDRFPFVVISPRMPINFDWTSQGMAKMLVELVDHVGRQIPLDRERISIAGIDAGANGAWRAVNAQPGKFSALTWVFTKAGHGPDGSYDRALGAVPGRAFIPSDNTGLIQGLDQQFGKPKMDWKTMPLPAGAMPLDDLPAFGDKDYLEWLEKQKLTGK